MHDWIAIGAFAGISAIVWMGVALVLRLQRDPIRGRLMATAEAQTSGAGEAPFGTELIDGLARQLPETPFENGELSKDLRRAGYYRPSARKEFLALRNALVIISVLVTGVLAVAIGPERQDTVIRVLAMGAVATAFCWGLPRVVVALKGRQRVERIRRALPDALDMTTMCLTSGLPLQDVLSHVSRELAIPHPDLALELLIVRHQTDMNSLEFAFQRLGERIDAPEVVSLANLIVQNQRLGANIANALRDYADSMRLKWRQAAEERSGLTQIGMLFPVIFCLLPAVMMLLWGPAVLELWRFFQGFEQAIGP